MLKTYRDQSVDALRGILLLIIGIDHIFFYIIPNLHGEKYTFETLGFCSAAEGFFFLAGYSCAKAYLNKISIFGFDSVKKKIYDRVKKIYLIQILFLFISLIIHPILYQDQSYLPLITHPLKQTLLGLTLLYQPTLLDILPLYILFLIIVPYILALISEGKTKRVVFISSILWLLSQFNPFGRHYHEVILPYFNPFSWQSLFILGMCSTQIKNLNLKQSKILLKISLLISSIAFFIRWSVSTINPKWNWWVSRSSIGILRMINVLAIFYIFSRLKPHFEKYFQKNQITKAFILAGQNSLEIFSWQIIVLLIFSHWSRFFQTKNLPTEILSLIIITFIMTIPLIIIKIKAEMYYPNKLNEKNVTSL